LVGWSSHNAATIPTIISYIKIPKVHQSTAEVWPFPLMTSGAIYSDSNAINQPVIRRQGRTNVSYLQSRQTNLFGNLQCRIGCLPSKPDMTGVSFVDTLAAHALTPFCALCFIPAGAPPGSEPDLERSKSDSMICPDWCNKISVSWISVS
jgi:hypothetical protein